jgi:hypothetical protein
MRGGENGGSENEVRRDWEGSENEGRREWEGSENEGRRDWEGSENEGRREWWGKNINDGEKRMNGRGERERQRDIKHYEVQRLE